MKDFWIKLILPGMDAVLGSLQGRLIPESFGLKEHFEGDLGLELNKAIQSGAAFRLYDPIQLRPHAAGPGQIGTVTIPLIQALEPAVKTDFVWINGANVQWWGELEVDNKWEQVVAQSIHGISLAGSGEIPDPSDSNIITPNF